MIKLVSSSDFNWQDIPSSLMKVASRGLDQGWAEKRAAVLTKELADLRPVPGHTLVHVLAVGDTEKTGANRNGDGFSGYWNAKNHDHFIKRAHVFQNHKNHDPKLSVGSVKLSAYNAEMGRIELVLALDNVKCAEAVDKLEKGEEIAVSMGCKVAHDVCSICGHKAPSPRDYCDHAKYAMTKILDDGRQVYVDNPDPGYFDISIVPRPAERTAFSFRKVASADAAVVSSTILAKQAGLWVPSHMLSSQDDRVQHKRAILHKLAEMEKEIEGKLTPVDESLSKTFEEGKLGKQDASRLQRVGLDGVLDQLAEAKVTLPLRDFLRLISREHNPDLEAAVPGAEEALPGVFSRMCQDGEDCEDSTFDGCPMSMPASIQEMLEPLIGSFGAGAPLHRRVTIAVIRGKPAPSMAKRASSPEPVADGLARLYARYKLAVLSHPANLEDEVLTRLAVLQNYTRA